MQLPGKQELNREIVIKAGLLLLAVALNALEFFIPRIPLFPWLKPGLANIITLIWIIRYGYFESLLYALLRVWIVSFYFGFSFLTFSLGFSGAVFACTAMAVCWKLLGRRRIIGTVGIAVLGALFHNMGQLFAVYLLMARNIHLFYQVPVMIFASVFFGSIVGLLVPWFINVVNDDTLFQEVKLTEPNHASMKAPVLAVIISLLFLCYCMVLVFVTDLTVLILSAVIITIIVQTVLKGSLHAFFFPIKRFWLLFLFIGVLHSFFTYGIRINGIPFITREGVVNTVTQWLRLWAWLETTFIFFHFTFHLLALRGLQKIFSGYRSTIYAGLLAVEFFPSTVDMVRSRAKGLLKTLFTKPTQVIAELFTGVVDIIVTERESL
jgi:heptaprenyl diphosphate synthase